MEIKVGNNDNELYTEFVTWMLDGVLAGMERDDGRNKRASMTGYG